MKEQNQQLEVIEALDRYIEQIEPIKPYDFDGLSLRVKKMIRNALTFQLVVLACVSVMTIKVFLENPKPNAIYTQSTTGHIEQVTSLATVEHA